MKTGSSGGGGGGGVLVSTLVASLVTSLFVTLPIGASGNMRGELTYLWDRQRLNTDYEINIM